MLLRQYLIFGLLFYAVVALLRWRSFKDADIGGILRGVLFGVVLWPVAMLYMLFAPQKDDSDES